MSGVPVRAAREVDAAGLPEIERLAGELFRSLGMDAVADDDLPRVEDLLVDVRAGRVLVAEVDGEVVGYAVLHVVDGEGHLAQVSVRPDRGRLGLGTALVEAAVGWARDRGLPALTLTTFAEVPWNRPYYERLGFVVVPADELGPGLTAVRAAEAAAGLDAWPRVAMRRRV